MTSSQPAKGLPSKKLRVASIVVLLLNGALIWFSRDIRLNLDMRALIGDFFTQVTWGTLFLSGLFFVWVMRTRANELFGGILLLITLALMVNVYFSDLGT